MKFFTSILAALALLLSPAVAFACEEHGTVDPPADPAVVYLTAHQDDEILAMGASIRTHVEAGRHVAVIVATDGSATSARHRVGEKIGREVAPWEIAEHRDREFFEACAALGATECMTAPAGLRMTDGQSTPAQADALLAWVMTAYPGAAVKSHSYLAPNVDHRHLGEALLRAYDRGVVGDARFYLSLTEQAWLGAATPSLIRTNAPVGDTEQDSYRRWAPDEWWAVGYTSVGSEFKAHRANPRSYAHTPHA